MEALRGENENVSDTEILFNLHADRYHGCFFPVVKTQVEDTVAVNKVMR